MHSLYREQVGNVKGKWFILYEKYFVKLGRILVEIKILALSHKAHVSICTGVS